MHGKGGRKQSRQAWGRADSFAVCGSALHEKNRAAHHSGPKFTGCTADRSDGAVIGSAVMVVTDILSDGTATPADWRTL